MKRKSLFVTVASAALLGWLGLGQAFGQEVKCPCQSLPDPKPKPHGAGDPAFLGVDLQPGRSLVSARQEARKGEPSAKEGLVDLSAESGPWKSYMERLQENPKDAYALAVEAWSQNFSAGFKKGMILKARGLASITDELNNLDFMLDCLESPEAQRRKLLDLARGNGLERNQAAARLNLMRLNPDLPSGTK